MSPIPYAFEDRLVPLIQAGTVCQTFRAPPVPLPRPGDRIRLLQRNLATRIISDPVCLHVARCEIRSEAGRIGSIRQDGVPVVWTDRFAEAFGYQSFVELDRLWSVEFGPSPLDGYIIEWVPPKPVALEVAA